MRLLIISLSIVLLSYHSAKASDTIVAIVNHEKIYQSDIDAIIHDLERTGTVIDDNKRKALIERFVEQKMIAHYAREKGYEHREKVQKQIQVMTEMVLRDSYLFDVVNKEVTEKALKDAFDKQMSEIKPRFEYKASHILVDNLEKAKMIQAEIAKGQDFAKMAKKYSSDGNADVGGDLGFFSEEMMVKPFSDATAALSVGEVSAPVQTDFGWHLIKLTDKRALPKPTFEQSRGQIEAYLSREAMTKHIEMIKKKSHIVFKSPETKESKE